MSALYDMTELGHRERFITQVETGRKKKVSGENLLSDFFFESKIASLLAEI